MTDRCYTEADHEWIGRGAWGYGGASYYVCRKCNARAMPAFWTGRLVIQPNIVEPPVSYTRGKSAEEPSG